MPRVVVLCLDTPDKVLRLGLVLHMRGIADEFRAFFLDGRRTLAAERDIRLFRFYRIGHLVFLIQYNP